MKNKQKQICGKEYMLLGLRKIKGISINEYEEKFGENLVETYKQEITKLTNKHLIEIKEGYIKLTNKGLDLANIVWEEFI